MKLYGLDITREHTKRAIDFLRGCEKLDIVKVQPARLRDTDLDLFHVVSAIRKKTRGLNTIGILKVLTRPQDAPRCACGENVLTRFEANAPRICNTGLKCPKALKIAHQKARVTTMNKYGVPYAIMAHEVQSKQQSTMIERYGVDFAMRSERSKKKRTATNVERYGVTHPMMLKSFVEKRVRTTLLVYGVRHVMQDLQILGRAMANNSGARSRVVLLGGRRVRIRGFEDIGLRYLVHKGVNPANITVDLEGAIAPIAYYDSVKRKTRRYAPDIRIGQRTIVEVKCPWTLIGRHGGGLANAQDKAKATMRDGYRHILLLIYKHQGKNRVLRMPPAWLACNHSELAALILTETGHLEIPSEAKVRKLLGGRVHGV